MRGTVGGPSSRGAPTDVCLKNADSRSSIRGATVKKFNEPSKLLEALIKAGKIHHNNDPLLPWIIQEGKAPFGRKNTVSPENDEQGGEKNKPAGGTAMIMAPPRAMV